MLAKDHESTMHVDSGVTNFYQVGGFANMESVNNEGQLYMQKSPCKKYEV